MPLLLLFGAIVILVLSCFLPLVSVHTYCENRKVAAAFMVAAIVAFGFLFSDRATSTRQKVLAFISGAIFILAIGINATFIVWATEVCRHAFDLLR